MNSNDTNRLVSKVARLYYEQDLTQGEIAGCLNLSRQKVQRLLKQARKEGVVQVIIRPVKGTFPELERALEARFGLQEAVVIESTNAQDQEVVSREVGAAAADYLERIITPGQSLVISWGGTLLGMVNALVARPVRKDLTGIAVIQGLGGLGDPNKEVHAADLTRRLAQVFNGRAILLPAPGVAGSKESREAFYADAHVRQALDQARRAGLAVMGIGAPRPDSILVREGEIVQWPELQALSRQGAVGDINLRFFDEQGVPVASDLDDRVIGLTLDEIRNIGFVIGIAGGATKFKAIHGALVGKLIDVLVTDRHTAQAILELE
jgi:DNA-binding transcriptional regulator LsrR (DeoR family)